MKRIKYFFFSLICIFSCNIVFADNEIVIKSITPVYDEESNIVVNNEKNNYGVIFNDKNQKIKYNVILENTVDKDLTVESIDLTGPTEDFLIYKLEGLKGKDVLKANSTKEVVVSLETIQKEGWGHNFNDELVASINFEDSVMNPNTDTKSLIVVLVLTTFISGTIIVLCKKNKLVRYVVLILTLSSAFTITNAKESIVLPIKLNVAFESQNTMVPSGCSWNGSANVCTHELWQKRDKVLNVYIENEYRTIENPAFKYDLSELGNNRVEGYLVPNSSDPSKYDMYIIADGLIYANENASYYFNMINLNSLNNLAGIDTSYVKDADCMFYYAGYNSQTFELDVTSLNTSNITNMNNMFAAAGYNNRSFTLDVSNFDTSNVIRMSSMFGTTGYNSKILNLDVSNFDTSNVTDMSWMFESAGHNSEEFSLDVSKFDTSKVVDMSYMFRQLSISSNKTKTSITIRNKNLESYDEVFSQTAYGEASIVVNYTKETEELVDRMIATKSTGTNIIKGELVE